MRSLATGACAAACINHQKSRHLADDPIIKSAVILNVDLFCNTLVTAATAQPVNPKMGSEIDTFSGKKTKQVLG